MGSQKSIKKLIICIIAGVVVCMLLTPVVYQNLYAFRDKAATSELRAGLKNAFTAAQAYLADHPKAVVNSEAYLRAEGWEPTKNLTFVRAHVSSKTLEAPSASSIVLQNSKLTKRNSTKVREDMDFGQGEIAGYDDIRIPEIRYSLLSMIFY